MNNKQTKIRSGSAPNIKSTTLMSAVTRKSKSCGFHDGTDFSSEKSNDYSNSNLYNNKIHKKRRKSTTLMNFIPKPFRNVRLITSPISRQEQKEDIQPNLIRYKSHDDISNYDKPLQSQMQTYFEETNQRSKNLSSSPINGINGADGFDGINDIFDQFDIQTTNNNYKSITSNQYNYNNNDNIGDFCVENSHNLKDQEYNNVHSARIHNNVMIANQNHGLNNNDDDYDNYYNIDIGNELSIDLQQSSNPLSKINNQNKILKSIPKSIPKSQSFDNLHNITSTIPITQNTTTTTTITAITTTINEEQFQENKTTINTYQTQLQPQLTQSQIIIQSQITTQIHLQPQSQTQSQSQSSRPKKLPQFTPSYYNQFTSCLVSNASQDVFDRLQVLLNNYRNEQYCHNIRIESNNDEFEIEGNVIMKPGNENIEFIVSLYLEFDDDDDDDKNNRNIGNDDEKELPNSNNYLTRIEFRKMSGDSMAFQHFWSEMLEKIYSNFNDMKGAERCPKFVEYFIHPSVLINNFNWDNDDDDDIDCDLDDNDNAAIGDINNNDDGNNNNF